VKFNDLEISRWRSSRRVGRGIAAGRGKTAGRGTKGQLSRAGSGRRPGFEGGQNPLMQRLPKLRGFRSKRTSAENVYTGQLNDFSGTVDSFALSNAGLISNPYVHVKLIYKGSVTKKLSVKLQSASENAITAIQKAGGSFETVSRAARTKQVKSESQKSE
jgi:large subunit ribosomal protein L15